MKSNEALEAFLAAVTDLWDAHAEEISALAGNSEDGKATIGFSAKIDVSGKVPTLTTKLSWSERHAPEPVITQLDANQLKLFEARNN